MQDAAMTEFELVVVAAEAETALVRTLRLAAPAGGALPGFTPGAHLRVSVPGLAEHRCYSLLVFTPESAGFERPVEYRLGVRIEEPGRGGSRYMHGLVPGDRIRVTGPKNDFPLHAPVPDEGAVVLMAGGIGITPIAAMAAALQAAGRPYVLHYSGRSRSQLGFIEELTGLAGPALHLHADDDPATRLDLDAELDRLDRRQHLYVCGPQAMIAALIDKAVQRGWPRERVHFELFAAAAPQAGDRGFEVELRRSGRVLTVPPGRTIVDVMEAAGCDPLYDCRRGECGVCVADVLEGVPDHRDCVLTEAEKAEGKRIHICVSRAKSARLVLDL